MYLNNYVLVTFEKQQLKTKPLLERRGRAKHPKSISVLNPDILYPDILWSKQSYLYCCSRQIRRNPGVSLYSVHKTSKVSTIQSIERDVEKIINIMCKQFFDIFLDVGFEKLFLLSIGRVSG